MHFATNVNSIGLNALRRFDSQVLPCGLAAVLAQDPCLELLPATIGQPRLETVALLDSEKEGSVLPS